VNAGGVGAPFVARFDSDCQTCGDLITEGDDAGYVDDEVVCGNCYSEAAGQDQGE
jgi:formylmethanofuran dehydrogenase subunit E